MKILKNSGRRLRRSMKAISPVIAVLLMIVIAVAASLVAYAWVMGYLGFTTAKVGKAIQIQSIVSGGTADPSPLTVWVQNVGDSQVELTAVYVNGLNATATITPATLLKGETSTILTTFDGAGQVTVKVVASDGTFMELKKTFTGSGGGGPTPTPPPAQQVTFVSAGTASAASGPNGNPTPAYPSDLQANDLILLQVAVRGSPMTTTVTPPTGFNLTPLYGPESTGSGDAKATQWIYYKFATGTESGPATVTISQSSGNFGRIAVMYAFRNVALTSFTEGGDTTTGYSATISPPSVTTSDVKRLAVSFEVLAGDPTGTLGLNSFTGESGGDWALAAPYNVYHGSSGNDHVEIGIQTATMANAGIISGGSDSVATYPWLVRSFALIPS